MTKYILAFKNEQGRALIGISFGYIGFNITGHMEFDSVEEVEAFRTQWKHHFSVLLDQLQIVPVTEKTTHQT